jgi:hypothetical protein
MESYKVALSMSLKINNTPQVIKGVITTKMNSIRSYMTHRFLSLTTKIRQIPPIHLGRWKIEDTSRKQNIKIDHSNSDNCFMNQKAIKQEEEMDEYLKYMM